MQAYTISYIHGFAYTPGNVMERLERMDLLVADDEFCALQKLLDLLCKMTLFRELRYERVDGEKPKINVYRKDDETGIEYICDYYKDFCVEIFGGGHYNFKTIDEQRKELGL